MKQRIKYPSDDYLSWRYVENMKYHNLIFRLAGKEIDYNSLVETYREDVMMPYVVDPSTGITKYIKAP